MAWFRTGTGGDNVALTHTGTATGSTTYQQVAVINNNDNLIDGTRYMELTQDIGDTGNDGNIFTFTNAAITTTSAIDYFTSDFEVQPSNVSLASGTCVVTVPAASSSPTNLTVRIYIK